MGGCLSKSSSSSSSSSDGLAYDDLKKRKVVALSSNSNGAPVSSEKKGGSTEVFESKSVDKANAMKGSSADDKNNDKNKSKNKKSEDGNKLFTVRNRYAVASTGDEKDDRGDDDEEEENKPLRRKKKKDDDDEEEGEKDNAPKDTEILQLFDKYKAKKGGLAPLKNGIRNRIIMPTEQKDILHRTAVLAADDPIEEVAISNHSPLPSARRKNNHPNNNNTNEHSPTTEGIGGVIDVLGGRNRQTSTSVNDHSMHPKKSPLQKASNALPGAIDDDIDESCAGTTKKRVDDDEFSLPS